MYHICFDALIAIETVKSEFMTIGSNNGSILVNHLLIWLIYTILYSVHTYTQFIKITHVIHYICIDAPIALVQPEDELKVIGSGSILVIHLHIFNPCYLHGVQMHYDLLKKHLWIAIHLHLYPDCIVDTRRWTKSHRQRQHFGKSSSHPFRLIYMVYMGNQIYWKLFMWYLCDTHNIIWVPCSWQRQHFG